MRIDVDKSAYPTYLTLRLLVILAVTNTYLEESGFSTITSIVPMENTRLNKHVELFNSLRWYFYLESMLSSYFI